MRGQCASQSSSRSTEMGSGRSGVQTSSRQVRVCDESFGGATQHRIYVTPRLGPSGTHNRERRESGAPRRAPRATCAQRAREREAAQKMLLKNLLLLSLLLGGTPLYHVCQHAKVHSSFWPLSVSRRRQRRDAPRLPLDGYARLARPASKKAMGSSMLPTCSDRLVSTTARSICPWYLSPPPRYGAPCAVASCLNCRL